MRTNTAVIQMLPRKRATTRILQRDLFNINQLDALNFIISLFQASTCFEHMCSKHVEAWNKFIIKFSASSWLMLNKYIEMHGQQYIKITMRCFSKSFSTREFAFKLITHNLHNIICYETHCFVSACFRANAPLGAKNYVQTQKALRCEARNESTLCLSQHLPHRKVLT